MVILFTAAVASAMALILLLRPMARHIGLVDHPGGRKDHQTPTPMLGGVAIFCAFFLILLTLDMPLGQWRSFFFASAVVFIIGMLDDLRETPPAARFIAQIAASLIIVFWGGVELKNLGALFSDTDVLLGMMAVPFTVFCGVGVINAANMLDGLDGLLAGILLIFFSILLLLAWNAGLAAEVNILLLLCGTLTGFLVFNFRFSRGRPALVFMGDAGSLFLGLAVAWFLIRYTQEPFNLLRPITAVWMFGLPIMDTVAIMSRRVMRGRSPFSPDREHFHHIPQELGYGVRGTVSIILGVSLLLSGIGLAGEWADVPERLMFYGFLLLFGVYFWGMNHAWKVNQP